ncbi:MAG: transglycosylase SLT domain-containing protein [Saprospiraceae bacterium]|nr:transglycosylase SLT domain-containing protein [Saprospiraceae bacterium]
MRLLLTTTVLILLVFPLCLSANDKLEYNEEEVKSRLLQLESELFQPKYNSIVKGYIKGYVLRNRERTERIIGRAILYFPIFEKYLKENNLPEALKYLPIVESALNPRAVSHAGAVGLWQFMPETAIEQGLKITPFADERCDPRKSTQAALRYLSFQYEKYNDWALALAAYNGGAGRVNRAIKRARSKNFWKIRRFLPRETRNYVPAFISVLYLMEYYKMHELEPEYPNLDLQITETIKIYNFISFYRIAQLTGLPLDVIEQLNPAYERGFVPEDATGNFVCLPKRVMPALKDYLQLKKAQELEQHPVDVYPVFLTSPEEIDFEAQYILQKYKTDQQETLETMAHKLKCTSHQLLAWNQLDSNHIDEGQQLVFYQPKDVVRFNRETDLEEFAPLPVKEASRLADAERLVIPSGHYTFFKGRYLYYIPREKMKLEEIARHLPGITAEEIATLNNCKKNKSIKAGKQLKIKRL